MDMSLFVLGALGALLTAYIGKNEIIPGFRPLFDTFEMEKEANEHKIHIRETEMEIDDMQTQLKEESVSSDLAQRLKIGIETSLSGLQNERTRLQVSRTPH